MFTEIPATPRSISCRRPIQGQGINDAPYKVSYIDPEGITHNCPFYSTWAGMLARCFSPKRRSSYENCTVDKSWLKFTVFKAWMEQQDWKGKVLDKDLLSLTDKHYSPETCVFISPALNNLLCLRNRHRGDLPLGVSKTKINDQEYFVASCSFYGKQKRLGYYKDPDEAHKAYKIAKLDYIKKLSKEEKDPRVKKALLNIY